MGLQFKELPLSAGHLGVVRRRSPLPLRIVALLALLTSALVPALLMALFNPVTPLTGRLTDVVTVFGWVFIFYPFSAGFAIAFGLPLFQLFEWLGILKWWSTLIVGCAIGAAIAAIIKRQILPDLALLLYAGMGGAAALLFWVIWARAVARRLSVQRDA